MVSTFTQPDYTAQSGATYKANLDSTSAVMKRLADAFAPHAQSSPNMTVALDAGMIPALAATATEVAAQNTATLTRPSSNPRKDIIYIDQATGAVAVATGAEAGSPVDPAVPAGKLAVARINWTTSMTVIANADLNDIRSSVGRVSGTAANQLVALDSAAKLPAVDGSQLTNLAGADATDLRLAFLLIAENAGDRLSMVGGIADPFMDETDVDTATSTNETYNPAGDFYSNSANYTADLTATGNAIKSTESGSYLAVSAFDNVAAEWGPNNYGVNAPLSEWIGQDFGADNAKHIRRFTIQQGYSNGTAHLVASLLVQWSDDGTAWTTQSTITPAVNLTVQTFDLAASAAHRYWRIKGNADVQLPGGARWLVNEIEMMELNVPPNMTLQSNAFTADATPTIGRVHFQVTPVDSITINTDLTAEISRDGGTNFTAATLVLVQTLTDGTKAYEDASVDISGQPSGTSMKWRAKTLNNKEQKIHGVVFQWA